MKTKCKHEWRQYLRASITSMDEQGFYCIYCKARSEE